MSGVAFPSTGPGGLISTFRGTAGVERRSSGRGELGGDLGGWRSPLSASHATGQVSPAPAGAKGGSCWGGWEEGERERERPPWPPFAGGGSANLQGMASSGDGGSAGGWRGQVRQALPAGRCAVPAGEGRGRALCFHCLLVLLHRPSLCQPSEWEPCLPAAPLLIRASAARACPSAAARPPSASPPTAFKFFDTI